MELNELAAIHSKLDAALKKAGVKKVSTFLKRKNAQELEFTIKLAPEKE